MANKARPYFPPPKESFKVRQRGGIHVENNVNFQKPDGRVRVALITQSITLGGAERWMSDLVKYTDKSEIQWVGVGLFHDVFDKQFGDSIMEYAPIFRGYRTCVDLCHSVDVVLSWLVFDAIGFTEPETPVVNLCHSPPECQQVEEWYAEKPRGLTHWAAISESAKRVYPLPIRDECRVVTNAIPRDRLSPPISKEEQFKKWGVPEGKKVLGYLGRTYNDKNPASLLSCLSHLGDEWVAVIVGKGPSNEEVKAEVTNLVESRIYFPGPTYDIGSALNAFTNLVVPSDYESFGYSITEGWAAGTPVICTPVGVAIEQPELCRFIPKRPTGKRLADAVMADYNDPVRTAARAAKAKREVFDLYPIEKFGREWTDYLVELAGESV